MVDLFSICLNEKFPVYLPSVPNLVTWKEDTLQHLWDHLKVFAFLPFALIKKLLSQSWGDSSGFMLVTVDVVSQTCYFSLWTN